MRRLALLASVLALSALIPAGAGSQAGPDGMTIDPDLLAAEPGPVSVIVSFDGEPSEATLDHIERIGRLHHVYQVIDGAHATIPSSALTELTRVEQVTRLDSDEALAWHLDTSRPAIHVGPNLWTEGFDGGSSTVAVVDTGIDSNHPSVDGRVKQGVVFTGQGQAVESSGSTDSDGHGTHVAGIAGGDGSSSTLASPEDARYAGVAVSSGLVSLDISASFTTSTAIRAFDWVHQNHEAFGIDVVQNSWGRKEVGQAYDPEDPAIRASNTLVRDDDLVVVFSAANQGPKPTSLSMEAMNPNVLTVGAVDDSGSVAEFSSRGPVILPNGSKAPWVKPDVAAPGVSIKSAAAGQGGLQASRYKALSGTSQAAPHVAGIAAMIRGEEPDLPAAAVMEAIIRSGRDIGPEGPDPATGHGYVSAPRALELAMDANGTLSVRNETYHDEGRIIAGSPLEGILPDDSGADSNRANGSFPVKPDAQRLRFSFTWTSDEEDLPAPQLRVRLFDPTGEEVLVPSEGQAATRTIEGPSGGEWSWEAIPASASDAGIARYNMTATIELSAFRTFDEGSAGGGVYGDEGLGAKASRAWADAQESYGTVPTYIAAAILGLLLLAVIVKVVT